MANDSEVLPLLVNWWLAKDEAVQRLVDTGKTDTGAQARNARHMQSIATFVRQMFVDAGLNDADVYTDSAIPGYYRRSKSWDVVAMHKGHLVAVAELKSQASSPGNNANNRIEEAIGSAYDAQAVQELTGAFGDLGMWAAWCMTFNRDCESSPVTERTDKKQSVSPQSNRVLFPIADEAFVPMTYASQYATAIQRMVARGVYQAGWMVTTWANADGTVGYDEPVPTATAQTLRTQIEARVKFALQALGR